MKRVLFCALLFAVIASPLFAQVPNGWVKLTGLPTNYSGVADGIAPGGDRENSYAWSMDVFNGYLYVGSNRNILSSIASGFGVDTGSIPYIPTPTDGRGRIFRMNVQTPGVWEVVQTGPDFGYRMMKTFKAANGNTTLYVGSAGPRFSRLLAINTSNTVSTVASYDSNKPKLNSIRAITEYNGMLVWTTEDANGVAIFSSPDPVNDPSPTRFPIPTNWFANLCTVSQGRNICGADPFDLVSYNGWLYTFFLTFDSSNNAGFWLAKTKFVPGTGPGTGWQPWQLIVGDQPTLHAKYPQGMGVAKNVGAVPIVYKNKVYVGTLFGPIFWLSAGIVPDLGTDSSGLNSLFTSMLTSGGQEIYRFDQNDNWQRVMPGPNQTGAAATVASGFWNPMNKYIWRFAVTDGVLYAGTLDLSMFLAYGLEQYGLDPLTYPGVGFDVWATYEGSFWFGLTDNGMNDPWNYGARSFAVDPKTGDLYLGTANPFYGCQVWKKASPYAAYRAMLP